MSTIATIDATDQITSSRADINTNFANLNADKIETSVLDTDTALAANSDAKIPSQKAVKAYVDANSILTISTETTTGVTHSLTTTASQKVLVIVKGSCSGTVVRTVSLKYNGVTKDTITAGVIGGDVIHPFSLIYTETPGAATQNITVTTDAGSLANVVIIVMKFNV